MMQEEIGVRSILVQARPEAGMKLEGNLVKLRKLRPFFLDFADKARGKKEMFILYVELLTLSGVGVL